MELIKLALFFFFDNVLELSVEKWRGFINDRDAGQDKMKIDKILEGIVEFFHNSSNACLKMRKKSHPLRERAPGWQDASEITSYAAQIVKARDFRSLSVQRCTWSWLCIVLRFPESIA